MLGCGQEILSTAHSHDLALCSLSHVLLPLEREVNVYSTISCRGVGRKYCQQLTLMIWLSAACPMSCCLWKGKSVFTVLVHARGVGRKYCQPGMNHIYDLQWLVWPFSLS